MEKLSTKEKKFISIVIHIKENSSQIASFMSQLEKLFREHFENYEYILVNNSGNTNINHALSAEFRSHISAPIQVIHLSWVHNIEDAMRAGIDLSVGDFIIEFDSVAIDFELDLIMQAYTDCINGFDVVAAVPETTNFSSSKLFYTTFSRFSKNITLNTETFRVVSRRMINKVAKSKEAFRYRKLFYHYSGMQTKSLVYHPTNTRNNKKDFSFSEKFSLASTIMVYYSNIGTKVSLILSLMFFLISILGGLYALISFVVLKGHIQAGWTTTMLFLSVSFTGIFGILAVISKYMEVLLKEIQVNSSYTYSSIETYHK